MAAPQTTKPKTKKPSEEAVLSRARRMLRAEKRKLWEALGFEGEFNDAAFDEHLATLAKEKESTMGESEKRDARIADLEKQLATANQKLSTAQESESKTRQALIATEKKIQRSTVENEIREEARKVGVRDLDYAVHVYREHLRKLPDDKRDTPPLPDQFFQDFKKDPTRKHLFAEEVVMAGPKSVADSAPAEVPPAQVNGNPPKAPAPAPNRPGEPAEGVEKMDQREFSKRTADKYGFRPTMYG